MLRTLWSDRTTGVPKSVLIYELDKVRYPNKEAEGWDRFKCSLLLQYEILEKLVTSTLNFLVNAWLPFWKNNVWCPIFILQLAQNLLFMLKWIITFNVKTAIFVEPWIPFTWLIGPYYHFFEPDASLNVLLVKRVQGFANWRDSSRERF